MEVCWVVFLYDIGKVKMWCIEFNGEVYFFGYVEVGASMFDWM
jgi:hypothetical protein